MKENLKKTAGVFLLAVILAVGMLIPVQAAERKGSITVELNDIGTDRKGITLECFLTAKQEEAGWKLTEAFAGSGEKPWNLSKSADYKKTAEKLSAWAVKKKLLSETKITDQKGCAVFSNLDTGIYLIRQKSGQKNYGAIAPFLVCIPMEEKGTLLYDVHTSTKGEELKKTVLTMTPSVTPAGSGNSSGSNTAAVKSSSSKVKNVKTGDDTALVVFWLLLIFAAGGTVGILYYRKKH